MNKRLLPWDCVIRADNTPITCDSSVPNSETEIDCEWCAAEEQRKEGSWNMSRIHEEQLLIVKRHYKSGGAHPFT